MYEFNFAAGLWGAKVFMNRSLLMSVFTDIIDNSTSTNEKSTKLTKYDDQTLLARYLVPVMNGFKIRNKIYF
jgi:hypothetical protein